MSCGTASGSNFGYGRSVLPSVAGAWLLGTFQAPSWTSWTHAALDYPPRASMGRISGVGFWRACVAARFRRWAGGEIAS